MTYSEKDLITTIDRLVPGSATADGMRLKHCNTSTSTTWEVPRPSSDCWSP